MPKVVSPRQWEIYENRRQRGWNIQAASKEARIGYATARRREGQLNAISPNRRRGVPDPDKAPGPIPLEGLRDEAKRALEDFSYFQRRYLGRLATPWQAEAAYVTRDLLESPVKEFAVVNAPPGAGKSTMFAHDLICWVIVRNRAIRILLGSKVESSAKRYVARVRRTLEATVPWLPEDEDLAKGLAVPAEATLADDFGPFKPEARDLWAAEGFVVAQHGNRLITEKEPTVSAYGMDSGFLGMRYDLIVWDDLVDKLVMRTTESRENQQEWWDDVAEKRLDPAGLLLLQGQRMGSDDLYRYALDKRVVPEDEEPDEESAKDRPQKYHHIVFKAHYDDRCENRHGMDAPYYPEGCLLDPRRLPWRELRSEMANPRNNFAVIYQQEDTDPEMVLVDPLWVKGGTGRDGMIFPGCWDPQRQLCELPSGLYGNLLSIATADPSPTKYWSVQWWIVRCADGQAYERYLMDHERKAMDAPSFLDWNNPTQSFSGLMQEWQQRSVDLGWPITHWIVEANAAQRFMLQYEHMRRWLAQWRVNLIPHQTARNKADPAFGVQTMGGIYKHGLVRLPGSQAGGARMASMKLVEEVTHWPGWRTEDTVMAQWFGEWHLQHLIPRSKGLPRLGRPSWLRHSDTFHLNRREGAA